MPGEAILVFVLQTLRDKWKEHKDLKDGEQLELQQLEQDLRKLLAFLRTSAHKSDKNDLFREFEMQITDLVYDVEDTIATCMAKKAVAANSAALKAVAAKAKNICKSKMAKQVKSIRQQRVKPIIDSITNEFGRNAFGDDRTRSSLQNQLTEGTKDGSIGQSSVTFIQNRFIGESSSQDQSNKQDKFVAFEDEETIIGYLKTESRNKVDVICITGMPGIGKTTLATKVFEHTIIVNEFPLRIWIRVSQRFNSRDVFLYILKRLTPKASSTPSDQELVSTVAACLRDKKFLIVVDDLWRVEDWKVIEEILTMGNGQGKVLVTSRENGIAGWHNHKLNGLGSEASLKLLKLKVFGPENCPPELEDVLKLIANSWGEVPLIILVIGGILKGILKKKKSIIATKEEWHKVVSKNVNEIIKADESKSIQDALQLSYDRLGDELRVCFLYTGLFPEKQQIPASTLTKLWIAEGFIHRKDGQSIEETARKVLDDLIDKNLLMASKKNLDQVITCLVHEMIRGFCIAKSAEENLFRVIKASTGGVFEPQVSDIRDFRRLSLHSNLSTFLSANPSGPRVRSFLCFFEEDLDLDPLQISTIPNAFNLLRILNFKFIKFGEFPEFTRLILLKHITVSINNLDVLPKRISKLLNLETLIVHTKSRSITVKANIWKMTRLRHLETKAAISLDSSIKGKSRVCEDLETMSRLSPDSCTETLCERAPRLKTLGIRGKVANLFNTLPLQRFRHLEKLKIVNDLVHESASENPLLVLPPLDHFPPNLNRLTLSKTYLQWSRHMPILASINTLKILKLKDNAFTGDSWRAEGAGFKEL